MPREARSKELGLPLSEPPRPAGRFVPAVQAGNLLFVSCEISAVSGRLRPDTRSCTRWTKDQAKGGSQCIPW